MLSYLQIVMLLNNIQQNIIKNITVCMFFSKDTIMNKITCIRELESYKYDYQYFVEKSKDIEKLKIQIEKSLNRLKEMKENNIEVKELNAQIQNIINRQAKEEAALDTLMLKKQTIENRINLLGQPYKNVFFLKYITGNTFDEIALKMNYSTKRIYQLHKKGMEIYEQICYEESVPEISTS